MNKNLILTVGFILSFSFSALADSSDKVLLAYNCANSVFNYSDSVTFASSCVNLYESSPNKSVLSTLQSAIKNGDIPDGLTVSDLEETVRFVESTNVLGSRINWKELN